MRKKQAKMTEQQFIAKFKKEGFDLYKTSGIEETYKELENAKASFNRKCEELQDVRSLLYRAKVQARIANSRLDKVIDTSLNNSKTALLNAPCDASKEPTVACMISPEPKIG